MRTRIALSLFLLAIVWLPTFALPAQAATPTVYDLKIERQPLSRALQEFAKQSGVQIIFFSTVTDGHEAPAVNGRFTAAAALGRLLNGSELTFREVNSKTIEVQSRVTREQADAGADSAGQPLRMAQTQAGPASRQAFRLAQVNGAASQGVQVDEKGRKAAAGESKPSADDKSTEVVVTGSRIRGLIGQSSAQPVFIMTAEDIERTGATSLGEVFGYVPQISSYTEGSFEQSAFAFGASSGSSTDTRVTASLRGAPAGGTLLLINGRRAPRNGQEQAGTDGYDLAGIPLSSIERVEVLLDGASAVYGADAVGGVINVILKKNYQGTDVKLTYGNAFNTDVHVFDGNITHGFGFGKFTGIVTLSLAESGNLMWVDRDFLTTQDRRAFGGTNGAAAQIPGANGTINIPANNTAGLPAGLYTIPAGSNGTNRTAAQYLAARMTPPGMDLGIWAAYNSPYTRQSAVANLEYTLNDNFSLFGELRGSNNESVVTATPLAASSVVIPANAPGNIFGVPVTMRRWLSDLPIHEREAKSRNLSAVVGMRTKLGGDWRMEASIGPNYTRPEYTNPLGFALSSERFTEALANPNPALRPNLFYDALTPGLNPNEELLLTLGEPEVSLERGLTWIYLVSADGPIADLWAGELRAAVGSEYRSEVVDFPLQAADDLFGARAVDRYATGVFAELRMPLLSDRQNIPFVDRLEVSAAVRRDMYAKDEFDDATKPRFGVMYRPFSWLMGRASYGEGYKVPTLNQLYAPERASTLFFSATNPGRDIYRGNEPVLLQMPILSGGNPDLAPEETESTTAGIVLDLPFEVLNGLSLSWDHFDHKYLNRISPSLSFNDRLAIFPELFTRGPNLSTDLPGWPGPITSFDMRAVNVSLNRITGWDAGLKYVRSTQWGDFRLQHNLSQVYRNENRPRPGAPPATNAVPEAFPLRMNGSVFWRRGATEMGVLMAFRGKFKRSLTERLTPTATRWDARWSHDFSDGALASGGSWWADWLGNTRMSLTVFNIFDRPPPISATGIPESSLLDAVGRRYSFAFTTSFGSQGR